MRNSFLWLHVLVLTAIFSWAAHAGTNNLATEVGPVIQLTHVNKFKTALSGVLVPRDSSGIVGNDAASLGSSTYRWNTLWADTLKLQNSAGTNAITLTGPSSIAAPYTLTLPAALPASGNHFLTVNSSGTISDGFAPDGIRLELNGTTLDVRDGGINTNQLHDDAITTSKIQDSSITKPKLVALGQQVSSSCGDFTTVGTGFEDITNLSVTITTTGRPVFIGLIGDGTGGTNGTSIESNATNRIYLRLTGHSATLSVVQYFGASVKWPVNFYHIDVVAAGTYTYAMTMETSTAAGASIHNAKLIAYEL